MPPADPGLAGRWAAIGAPLRRLPRWAAILLLLAAALASVWSAQNVAGFRGEVKARSERVAAKAHAGDNRLYERTLARMAAGEGYYPAAVSEQRAGNYPVKPFVTVRQPTLAWLDLQLGLPAMRVLAIALLAANVLAWIAALELRTILPERAAAVLMLGVAGVFSFAPAVALTHEMYAGLLLSLALAVYRPRRWWPALLLAAGAIAIREIALPFVLLWAVFALDRRSWRELGALAVLLALFAAGMALHARAVTALLLPGDPVSPGWDALAGPALFVGPLVGSTLLGALPDWLAGPAAVLPLLGWLALGGRRGLFAALWFAGHIVLMSVFARTDNFYWNLLILPAYCMGLAFVPRALADLGRAALGRPLAQPAISSTL
ncbi:MAG: hypothetical protein P0Y56_08210 [Candidatus Andeanibacterium colombiense]|uniref:Uncharacterized protein n=1 Tax=Candidatus Andeanibacterium colombiense TaxID=3121345 RepID=A0AAJ6BP89_9SPHN|nr:MAG: hypothetical protein P0Y56_08210 [Sphingomonadaceae bacterium]